MLEEETHEGDIAGKGRPHERCLAIEAHPACTALHEAAHWRRIGSQVRIGAPCQQRLDQVHGVAGVRHWRWTLAREVRISHLDCREKRRSLVKIVGCVRVCAFFKEEQSEFDVIVGDRDYQRSCSVRRRPLQVRLRVHQDAGHFQVAFSGREQ